MAAGVPAVQIAVSQRGGIIYSEAFGITDRVTAAALTPQSVLRIGSITKQFTAAAILRLAERGALSLDDRIEKYVPEFDNRGEAITLRQLLSHTGGVRRDWLPPPGTAFNPFLPVTRAQTIKALNAYPLEFKPGTQWSYSNAGYMLLGFAIESITGRSYVDFMHEEFVLPLGLLDTGVCGTSTLPLPEGYSFINGTWIRIPSLHTSVMLSSGSFCSTASDLVRWAYLLETGAVMLPGSYVTMTTPARLANNSVVSNGYALGVSTQKWLGQPAVSHGGAVNGFLAFLLYFPDQDIAVAVVTNAFPAPSAGNVEAIAAAVAKAALPVQ